jgi:hypothetical protein
MIWKRKPDDVNPSVLAGWAYHLIEFCARVAVVLLDLLTVALAPAIQALSRRNVDEFERIGGGVPDDVPHVPGVGWAGSIDYLQVHTQPSGTMILF